MNPPESGVVKDRKTIRRRIRDLVFAEDTILVALAVIIGFAAGLGAWAFLELIHFFRLSWSPWGAYSGFLIGDLTTLLIPFIPALGGLLLGPFGAIFPTEARGHGVPEVMESVVRKGGVLKPRTILIRGVASAITIGTGGSAGREGPIAQIGSAIGSYVAQIFKMSSNNVRTLLGAGAAGGIAAAFNAPIAGALFALEIVLGDWHITTFTPVIMSSVIATVTSRYLHGGKAIFDVPYYQLVNPVEIIFYIILGLISGLVALLFIHSLDRSEHFFEEKIKVHPWLKPAIGGFLVGIIGLAFPQIFSNGYEPMGMALMGSMAFWLMFSLVFMKILATSITLGSGGSGGIFAPALYIGAMLGGAFGTIVNILFPFTTAKPGAYALVGMGSVLAAAAHAPLTNILLLFELTGDYHIILPIMVACIMSTLTIRALSPHSIFSIGLHRKGITIEAGAEVNVLQSLRVRDAMTTKLEVIPEDMPFGEILRHITLSRYSNFPMVNQEGQLTGMISFQDVRQHVFDPELDQLVIAKDLATLSTATVSPSDNLKDALSRLAYGSVEQLAVVDTRDPSRLLGILTRSDIITAYNKAISRYEDTG
ncbi:MAG: chloride channel protein [bacterium]|nr:MAG: chloride channel protein [bacterium]